jgi:hypothetical protein
LSIINNCSSVRYYVWQLRSAILLALEMMNEWTPTFFFKKGRWLTQAGYWFILRFCEYFTCLSSKIQNAIKLENISNLITSPSSYQCIRRKTRLVHFVIHGRTRYYSISLYWAQVRHTTNLVVPCDSRCEITVTAQCKQTKRRHIAYNKVSAFCYSWPTHINDNGMLCVRTGDPQM